MKIRLFSVLPLLALTSILGTAVIAAPAGNPPQKPGMDGRRGGGGRMMGRMAKELGLSEAQKSKLTSMMKAQMPQYRAIRENASLTPDQKRAKTKSLRDKNNQKMMAILTPAQRSKFTTMLKERRSKMGGMRMNKKPA